MTQNTNPPSADDWPFEPDILISVTRMHAEIALNRTIPIEHWLRVCHVLHEKVDDQGEDFGLFHHIIADMGYLLDAIKRGEITDTGEAPDTSEAKEPISHEEAQDRLRRLREKVAQRRGDQA